MFEQAQAGTITYEVFHARGDFFWTSLHYGYETSSKQIREAFEEGLYRLEDTFSLPAVDIREQLEKLFKITNHGNWGRPDSRSTSVGDVVRVQNQYWIVAPEGFDYGWRDG